MAIRHIDPHKVYPKREVEGYYDHHPAVTSARQCGTSHKVYKGPRGSFVVPTGPGDCPRGTLKSILTQAAAAGVLLALLAVLARFAVA
jgi:hypothetical protein